MLLDFIPPNARLRRTWTLWCEAERDFASQQYHQFWEEGPFPPPDHVLQRLEDACRRLILITKRERDRRPSGPQGA